MKKSVVAITQVPSGNCQTAASSAVSVPTRSCGNSAAGLARQKLLQHGGRQLAAAAAAMGKLGQAQLRHDGGGNLIHVRLPNPPMRGEQRGRRAARTARRDDAAEPRIGCNVPPPHGGTVGGAARHFRQRVRQRVQA